MVRSRPECVRRVLICQLSRKLLNFNDQILSLIWERCSFREGHDTDPVRQAEHRVSKKHLKMQLSCSICLQHNICHISAEPSGTILVQLISQSIASPWVFYTDIDGISATWSRDLHSWFRDAGYSSYGNNQMAVTASKSAWFQEKQEKIFCFKNGQNVQCLFLVELLKSLEYFTI